FHRVPLNDVWFRDNGPLFVREADGRVAMTDWRFNAWGGKYAPWDDDDRAPLAVARRLGMRRYAVDAVMEGGSLELNGRGVCLTTRSCLLTPTRNPGLSQADIEALLARWLGVTQVVWLPGGLEGDHTDGHIDTIVRFADDETIVASVEADESDPNHASMLANLEVLRGLRTPAGRPYRIVELPLPERSAYLGEARLPLTYANWYVGNGFVVVPVYDDPNDERALETLRPLFPGRDAGRAGPGAPAAPLLRARRPPAAALRADRRRWSLPLRHPAAARRRGRAPGDRRGRGRMTQRPGTFRIGVVQMSCSDVLEENLDKAEAFVREAAANGAGLVLLQELFENLYFPQLEREELFALAH